MRALLRRDGRIAQALAAVYFARRFVGRHLALVPIAYVSMSPSLLGDETIGQDQSDVEIIR